jgi:hypothetical protein
MSYAIKFNAETNILTFSDSLIKELTKQHGYVNFVFGYDNFTVYTTQRFIPNSDYKIISTELINKKNEVLVTQMSTCLELPCDWKCKYSKGELKLVDKCKGNVDYVIYFEKLAKGIFRTLTSKIDNKYSRCLNDIRNGAVGYNFVFSKSKTGNRIKKGFARRQVDEIYSTHNTVFHLTSSRYSYSIDFPVEKKDFLGVLNQSIVYYTFIILNKERILRQTSTLSRELRNNFKANYKYLFADIIVKNKELFVTYVPYQKAIYLVYEKGYSISGEPIKTEIRQEIKLTKYIQDIYPEYSSEKVKEEYDRIAFKLCPPDPEIKEVKGEDILDWYDTKKYHYDLGSGPLSSSCMRDPSHRDKLQFYSKNSSVSLIILTIGDKLIGRALLWNCVDGSKVVDRPYLIRESDFMCLEEYMKSKNYLFVYDFRERTDKKSKGYNPSYFSDNYEKEFEVQLDFIPDQLKVQKHPVAKRVEYNPSPSNIPYLDNFNFFDTHNMKLMTYRDEDEYKKNHEMYGITTTNENCCLKKELVTTYDGKTEHIENVYESIYHDGFIYYEDAASIDGDYINRDLCIQSYNGIWYLKDKAPESVKVKVDYKLGDKVRITGNSNSSINKVGDIGTIVQLGEYGTHRVHVPGRRDHSNNTYLEEMELYVEEPVGEVSITTDLTEQFIAEIDEMLSSQISSPYVNPLGNGILYQTSNQHTYQPLTVGRLEEVVNQVMFPSEAVRVVRSERIQQEEVLTRSLNQEELEYVDEIRIA